MDARHGGRDRSLDVAIQFIMFMVRMRLGCIVAVDGYVELSQTVSYRFCLLVNDSDVVLLGLDPRARLS